MLPTYVWIFLPAVLCFFAGRFLLGFWIALGAFLYFYFIVLVGKLDPERNLTGWQDLSTGIALLAK
jgi:hypothetical protein